MDSTRTVAVDWNHELLDQLEFHWGIIRPRFDTITDEQLLREPVAGMWSVRPRAEATTPDAAGAGDTVVDYAMPAPEPAPMTTIAWRLAHLAMVFGERAANHFGDGGVTYTTVDWPLTTAGMLAELDRHHDAWVAGVAGLGSDGLAHPSGAAEGPFSESPMATLVLHIHREAIHHAAEVALLLDLYTHTADDTADDTANDTADDTPGGTS